MISKERYVSALRQLNPESLEHKAVAALFTLPECRGTAPLVAAQAGWPSYSVANLAFGNAARRVAEFLGEIPPERATDDPGWWSILADGVRNERGFWWTLRPAVVAALRDLEWSTAEACANLQGGEMPHEKFQEGAMVRVCVSSYERNRAARLECIRQHGTRCKVCDFDFEATYGEIGRDYIHVHHIVPISEIGRNYQVDPGTDLVPVCANCHAMLHAGANPPTVQELACILTR